MFCDYSKSSGLTMIKDEKSVSKLYYRKYLKIWSHLIYLFWYDNFWKRTITTYHSNVSFCLFASEVKVPNEMVVLRCKVIPPTHAKLRAPLQICNLKIAEFTFWNYRQFKGHGYQNARIKWLIMGINLLY